MHASQWHLQKPAVWQGWAFKYSFLQSIFWGLLLWYRYWLRNDHNFDIEFSESRISNLLASINSNKACGPDGIHGKIFKNCADNLAVPLSIIFKVSYNSGIIPMDWKVANVVPVYKKGSKDDIENCRPISLTCLTMKTFERILKEELLARTSHLLIYSMVDSTIFLPIILVRIIW